MKPPKTSPRPLTRTKVKDEEIKRNFALSGKTTGFASDLYFAAGIDAMTGKKKKKK